MIKTLAHWVGTSPVSTILAIAFIVGSAVAGTLLQTASPAVFDAWAWSYTNLASGGNWLTVVTSGLIPPGPIHLAVLLLVCVFVMTRIERLIGSWRLGLVFLMSTFGAVGVVLLLQLAGSSLGELWIGTTLDQTVLDPFAGIIGVVMASTAFMTTLWRRRIRILVLALLSMYVLYGGDIVSTYRGVAAIIGLAAGLLLKHERPTRMPWMSTQRETRTLLALLVAVTAIGPIIAVAQDVSIGPLAGIVFLIDDPRENPIALLAFTPLLLLVVSAWGIRSGRRGWLWIAVAVELFLAGSATYGYFIAPLIDNSLPEYQGIPSELYAWWAAAAIMPLVIAGLLIGARRRIGRRRTRTQASELQRMRFLSLAKRTGTGTFGFMGTWKDNLYWFSPDIQAAVAYRLVDKVAITLSDPICAPDDQAAALSGFIKFCDQHHWTVAFYSVHPETTAVLEHMGWANLPVAEEATIDPSAFRLKGPQAQNLRTAINHAERARVTAIWKTYRELNLAQRAQIVGLSEQWVADKHLPEMGFTLGGLNELKDPHIRLMIAVDDKDRVHAVTSWLPIYRDGGVIGWSLDFMRRRDDAVYGVTDFLITKTILKQQDEQMQVVSLAGTPLLQPSQDSERILLNKLLGYLGRTLEPVYGFRSLAAFKKKYRPNYQTLSLVYHDGLSLGSIAKALGKAYLPSLTIGNMMTILRRKDPHPKHKSQS